MDRKEGPCVAHCPGSPFIQNIVYFVSYEWCSVVGLLANVVYMPVLVNW